MATGTKCQQLGCKCTKYIENSSKWRKGKCNKCDHRLKDHEIAEQAKNQKVSMDNNVYEQKCNQYIPSFECKQLQNQQYMNQQQHNQYQQNIQYVQPLQNVMYGNLQQINIFGHQIPKQPALNDESQKKGTKGTKGRKVKNMVGSGLFDKINRCCDICQEMIGIMEAPIKLQCCGLKLHDQCFKDLVNSKLMNGGDKISLNKLGCPICRKQMRTKSCTQLFKRIDELYENIKGLVLNRLELEHRMNDDALINIDSEYYNNPIDYGMKIYSFFICYKCRNPYYGGLNDCVGGLQDDIDPKQRLCLRCGPPQNFETVCNIHGTEYIQWKCRFCCSLATFFCFGTTHFCESCHCSAYQLAGMAKEQLIQCPCKSNLQTHQVEHVIGDCPLGINHPPSGQEYCLGCAYCKK